MLRRQTTQDNARLPQCASNLFASSPFWCETELFSVELGKSLLLRIRKRPCFALAALHLTFLFYHIA
jgi:hypothetical protein